MPKPQPAIVHTLNARFRNGKPSNDLDQVGLLLRQFDNTEDHEQPWRGCPAKHVVSAGAGEDCKMFGNRFSASIVNAAMSRAQEKIRIFSLEIGVIYSSRVSLNCIYGGDGGTRSKPVQVSERKLCALRLTSGRCEFPAKLITLPLNQSNFDWGPFEVFGKLATLQNS